MRSPYLSPGARPLFSLAGEISMTTCRTLALGACAAGLLLCADRAQAQITVDTHTGVVTNSTGGKSATVDRRYQQIEPTHVPLGTTELDAKTRLELIRVMQSEQGFAMRPLPRGTGGWSWRQTGISIRRARATSRW